MKLNQLRPLYSVGVFAFIALTAACGSQNNRHNDEREGGGGNARYATLQDVKEAISQIDMSKAFFEVYQDRRNIGNPRLRVIFAMLFGSVEQIPEDQAQREINFARTPIARDIKKSRVLPKDGPCPDRFQHPNDGGQKKGEVCVSLTRFQRITRDAVMPQILAIEAHEFTHHFNLGEDDANLVQDFFLKNGHRIFYRYDEMTLAVQFTNEILVKSQSVRDQITSQLTVGQCTQVGALAGEAAAVEEIVKSKRSVNIGSWGERFHSTEEQYWRAQRMRAYLDRIASLCQYFADHGTTMNDIIWFKAGLDESITNGMEFLNSLDLDLI